MSKANHKIKPFWNQEWAKDHHGWTSKWKLMGSVIVEGKPLDMYIFQDKEGVRPEGSRVWYSIVFGPEPGDYASGGFHMLSEFPEPAYKIFAALLDVQKW